MPLALLSLLLLCAVHNFQTYTTLLFPLYVWLKEREMMQMYSIMVYNKCVYLSVTQKVIIAVNTVNEQNQRGRCCCLAFICNQHVSLVDECAAVRVCVDHHLCRAWLRKALFTILQYAWQDLCCLPVSICTPLQGHAAETHTKGLTYTWRMQQMCNILIVFLSYLSFLHNTLHYSELWKLYTLGNDLKQKEKSVQKKFTACLNSALTIPDRLCNYRPSQPLPHSVL